MDAAAQRLSVVGRLVSVCPRDCHFVASGFKNDDDFVHVSPVLFDLNITDTDHDDFTAHVSLN